MDGQTDRQTGGMQSVRGLLKGGAVTSFAKRRKQRVLSIDRSFAL